MSDQRKHARFSPSALESKELCLRYDRKDTPDDANEGIELHEAYASKDLRGLDEEQRNQVEKVIQYTESLIAGMPQDGLIEESEPRLEIPEYTFGFADKLIVSGPLGHVLDAKFGRKAVSLAEDNFQIWCYVAGTFYKYPQLEEVWGHIVSPRQGEAPEPFCFNRTICEQTIDRIKALFVRLEDPFNPPTPNDELCAMCKWVHKCPAVHKTLAVVAQGLGLPTPEVFDPESMVSIRDRVISQLLKGVFKNWAEVVGTYNNEWAKIPGNELPGFKLLERSTGVKIDKERTAEAVKLLTAGYAGTEEILAACTLSVAELSKVISELRGTSSKAEKETIREILADLTTEGKTSYLQKSRNMDIRKMLEGIV